MNTQHPHLDAGESAFFSRQLELIKSTVYEVQYGEYLARKLFPVSTEGGPGLETITYRMFDRVGMAKVISSYADDLPDADVLGLETITKVRELGDQFHFTWKEIQKAAYSNTNLRDRKAKAARLGMWAAEDQISFAGSATYGMYGILNHPNTTAVSLPADGTGAAVTFASKTAAQILRDMNTVANTPSQVSKNVEKPNVLLMPVAQYNLVASTPVGTYNDKTVLRFFLDNNPYIKEVVPVPQLQAAGAGGTDVMVAYSRDPMKMELAIPSDFQMLAEQARGLKYVTPCVESFGGLIIYFPLSVAIAAGI